MTETFIAALTRHARERSDAMALVDDRARLTWGQVAEWVEAAAGWLVAHGLDRGVPVLGWLPNAAEWYLLRLACERAGFLWVPLPASHGVREVTSIVARIRPAVLVTIAHFRGRDYVTDADEVCRLTGAAPVRVTVPDTTLLRLEGSRIDSELATRPEESAHLLATTGSEGAPKLSAYTLQAAAERGTVQAALLTLGPEDVVVALSAGTGPGKTPWLAAPMAGAAVAALPVFRPTPALTLIERERATVVCGTPAQLAMMLPEVEGFDLSRVRVWYTAGSVLSPGVAAELEARTNGVVLSVYGATDFGGWAAPDVEDPPAVRHHTVGRPRGGTELRVVDRNGRDVVTGEVGEVLGRGPCCVGGYYGDPALTQERWRDGWFATGDLGRFDERGNLVIVGRARDLIIRGGDNISPEEIETLLRAHPAIAQVAVVGVPDPILGERVCACVVPTVGPLPTLEALREHLRQQRIAHHKLPERLVLLPSIPIVGDKVNRVALIERAAKSGHGTSETPLGDR